MSTGAPYGVRLARPRSYLDFEKQKAAAATAAGRHYRGLTWLGRARRAGGAPVRDKWPQLHCTAPNIFMVVSMI